MNEGLGKDSVPGRLWAILAALAVLCCCPVPAVAGMDRGAEDPVPTNVYLMALTVLYEATGQPVLGQELVARVVFNRVAWIEAAYFEQVVFANGQFMAWTPERKRAFQWCQIEQGSDPACFDRMALKWLGSVPDARERWLDLLAMSWAVTGGAPDPVGWTGVRYFDNPRFWPEGEPPWASAKVFVGQIGDHCFWR